MSTSISQHFSPWSLLKFTFPSIIMMMFMSLYTIVDGIFISRFIGSNALSDGKSSAIISFCRTLLFTVISLLVLPRFFGVNGAWLAIPVAEFVTLLLSIWMHRKYLYRFI